MTVIEGDMEGFIVTNEPAIRVAVSVIVFSAFALLQFVYPRRALSQPLFSRWGRNIAIVVIDGLVVRLLFPLLAVGVAIIAREKGWGFFNLTDWPVWFEILLAIIALDLLVYGQHVAFHKIPVLWRIHRVHHTDLDIDLTTGVRFHPFEIIISMGLKMMAVLVLGASPVAVILFEIILNGTALFNHANLRLAVFLDRILRLVLVTPDMHRVHHSVYKTETDSNYGFNLSWWDHLFGTYRAAPQDGHTGMTIGLPTDRDPARLTFWRLLAMPFGYRYPPNRTGKKS